MSMNKEQTFESLQERIIFLLNEKNIKQSHAAKFIGVTKATVSDWVNGRSHLIKSDNALEVAKYFNVNYEWVINGKGPMRGDSVSIIGRPVDLTKLIPLRKLCLDDVLKVVSINGIDIAIALDESPDEITAWLKMGRRLEAFICQHDLIKND